MWETVHTGWFWAGSALHLAAFGLIFFHALLTRKEAAALVLWLFLAWSFPLIGPLLYIIFGVNRVAIRGWQKRSSNQRLLDARKSQEEGVAMPMAYWKAIREAMADAPRGELARETHTAMNVMLSDFPLLTGNSIDALVDGDGAYPAMLDAIASAQHHIHLQTFILADDAVGRRFMEALKARAEAGVRVRVLCDAIGSGHAIFKGLFGRYKAVRGMHLAAWTQTSRLKRFFQINLRNHRKLLLVDGHVAFTGGLNLHEENNAHDGCSAIRDYHFHVRGPVVQELQYGFMRDWYYATGEDPDTLLCDEHFPKQELTGSARIRAIPDGPESEEEIITDTFFAAISAARKTLLIATPYFVPPPDILRALRSAALRGVDTRLMVPVRGNHRLVALAGEALYEPLLTSGVRIFRRRAPFIHAKALLVDDTLAIVGTANMDARSLRLNYETNLAIYDSGFINQLKEVILNDQASSDLLQPGAWGRRSTVKRLAESFCHLLAPVL